MVNTTVKAQEAEASEAQRMAEEERARKRATIQDKIQQWNTTLSAVNSQFSDLQAERSKLNTYLGDWETKKNIYGGNEILSDVVIVNIFEGVCAERVKDDFSLSIAEMDRTYSGVRGLNENVGVQIERLNQYMSVIKTRLASLRNELNSI